MPTDREWFPPTMTFSEDWFLCNVIKDSQYDPVTADFIKIICLWYGPEVQSIINQEF